MELEKTKQLLTEAIEAFESDDDDEKAEELQKKYSFEEFIEALSTAVEVINNYQLMAL